MENKHHKVLLIGGAGYVGTAVSEVLLMNNYRVASLDSLIYDNFSAVMKLAENPNYHFQKGDLRNQEDILGSLEGVDDVIVLAGLVGDPITKKYPELSRSINQNGISSLFDLLNGKGLRRIVFISTCSNYGLIESNELASEDHPLKPLSLYAEAKVEMEEKLLNQMSKFDYSPVILRFATAFGISSRMRFDLTVNEFARDIALGKTLTVYDADTWRPYCHIKDFGRLVHLVLQADEAKVKGEVFNAGGNKNNATKRAIAESLRERIPGAKIKYQEQGADPRNYRVDFRKVKQAFDFEPDYSIEDGISEILEKVLGGEFNDDSLSKLYGNYEIPGAQ